MNRRYKAYAELASLSQGREEQCKAALVAGQALLGYQWKDPRELSRDTSRTWRRIAVLALDLVGARELGRACEVYPEVLEHVRILQSRRAAANGRNPLAEIPPIPECWQDCLPVLLWVIVEHSGAYPQPRAEEYLERRADDDNHGIAALVGCGGKGAVQ